MNEKIREQAYISVVLAEINGIAQQDSKIITQGAYWSNKKSPFYAIASTSEYATFEGNFVRADGSFLVMPRPNTQTLIDVGYATPNFLQAVTITFGAAYAIKGLTINFGSAYPTEFVITTDLDTEGTTYTNNSEVFRTTDTFGDISSLTITPTTMVGGIQRLRIKQILMGVGLTYNNDVVSSADITEEISDISEDIPNTTFNVTVLDKENEYNVNNRDSFIDYLTSGQVVTISFGVALDEDSTEIEWLQTQILYLTSWSSKNGEFTFTANNVFSQQTDNYTLGNRIYTRTAYQEAVNIFTDLGLEPDDYTIDNYLNDITLTNPLPEDTHANCLLLLCNACRCIFFQDGDGVIHIQGNFALNLEPEDIELNAVGYTDYSNPRNVLTDGAVMTHYANFSQRFVSADGSMLILPRDSSQYDSATGYVSAEVSDGDGSFINNPNMTLKLEAGYVYYGLYLNFAGTPPTEVVITTSYNGNPVDSYTFTDLENENDLVEEFHLFDTMKIEFTKTIPHARVAVDKVGLGNITDYILDKNNMTSQLIGTRVELVKDIRVKIYSFANDEQGKPQEVQDDIWYTHTINTTGVHKEVTNQLISTQAMAEDLAEWLGTHYKNNYTYEVDYRGDPRLNAADVIKLEDEYVNNLQVRIDRAKLEFNGAFRGHLEMRRAMRE